jgi:hypothetical protein
MFNKMEIFFYCEELLAIPPKPKLDDHPFSAVRDCLFNIFAITLYIGRRSSSCNPMTRHDVVKGTHLARGLTLYSNDIKHGY